MYITTLLLRALSVLSVVYFLLLVIFSGIRTSFLWFWLLLAAFPSYVLCCFPALRITRFSLACFGGLRLLS